MSGLINPFALDVSGPVNIVGDNACQTAVGWTMSNFGGGANPYHNTTPQDGIYFEGVVGTGQAARTPVEPISAGTYQVDIVGVFGGTPIVFSDFVGDLIFRMRIGQTTFDIPSSSFTRTTTASNQNLFIVVDLEAANGAIITGWTAYKI